METKIKSIIEAFSIQPRTLSVCKREYESNKPHAHKPDCIKEIKKIQMCKFEPNEFIYVGYNFKGSKLFEYQSKSVNVEYFTE